MLEFLCCLLYIMIMEYRIEGNKIIFEKNNDFDAKSILECGQMFRFFKTNNGYKAKLYAKTY